MAIKKLNLELLKKLSNSFASFHYDADVDCVQKARVPTLSKKEREEDHLTDADLQIRLDTFNANMAKADVTPLAKGTPNPFKVVHKTSDYVVTLGAKLSYVRKNEAIMKRGGVEGKYTKSFKNRGMFPVYSELIYVKDDLSTMYFVAYRAGVPKTVWTADGKNVKKEEVCQIIKDTKIFNKLCGLNTDYTITDKDGYEIIQKNEDGSDKLGPDGKPMTMASAPYQNVKIENAVVTIKGEPIKFTTDEDWDLAELARIRDNYYEKLARLAEAEAAKEAENK